MGQQEGDEDEDEAYNSLTVTSAVVLKCWPFLYANPQLFLCDGFPEVKLMEIPSYKQFIDWGV